MTALALSALRLVIAIGMAVAEADTGKITPEQARLKIAQAHSDFAAHKAIDDKIDEENRHLDDKEQP